MASSNGSNRERQTLAVRIERYTDFGQDWVFQLVLVGAIVVALIGAAF